MPDLSITAANVKRVSGVTSQSGVAGATITAGQLLYQDGADSSKLKPADADATVATSTIVGVALHGALTDQPVVYASAGEIAMGATLVRGELYVASDTPGGIKPADELVDGDYVSIVGYAKTTANMVLLCINTGVIYDDGV